MRHRNGVLSLIVLASIGIMAMTASAAQAEGKLRINGTVLKEGEVAEAEGTGGAVKLAVKSLGLTVACTSSTVNGNGGNLPHWHWLWLWLWSGCTVEGNKGCEIYPTEEDLLAGTNKGRIHWHWLWLWLWRLVGRDHFRSSPFLNLRWYYGGAACTLPEEAETSGISVASMLSPTTEAVEHELVDATAAEEETLIAGGMTDIGFFYGKEPAEIVGGSAKIKLIGKFAGAKFSVD